MYWSVPGSVPGKGGKSGGLRPSDPNDLKHHKGTAAGVQHPPGVTNGYSVTMATTSVPRRHTVTMGGMDVDYTRQHSEPVSIQILLLDIQ